MPYQFPPVNSCDQKFFHLVDAGNFARLDVNQKCFQVFGQFALGRFMCRIVRNVVQEADVVLPVAPKREADSLHTNTPSVWDRLTAALARQVCFRGDL